MKSPITFAKIVATPTDTSWSQAYNAGNLAAVISLVQQPIENTEATFENELSLQALGKELLSTLEAEYFTLETKNLTTVKQAITTTVEKIEGPVTVSLGVSVIIENVLYVFLYGAGKILMKRKEKLGTLLEQSQPTKLTAASGFIENNDIVILETPAFSSIVSTDLLLPCLEHDKLATMAEILSPVIHEHTEGAAAAIAFSYKEEGAETESAYEVPIKTTLENEPEEEEEEMHEEKESESPKIDMPQRKVKSFPALPFSHSRRLFLTIGIIIVFVLIGSIYLSMKHQKEAELQNVYSTTVVPAQKKYDEGQSLLSLNKNLAKDDFQTAKNILEDAKNRFPANSTQEKQVMDLLQKVNDGLTQAAQVNLASAKQVDSATSPLLSVYINNTNAKYVDSDSSNYYFANNSGISAVSKTTNKVKSVVTSGWKNVGGFGVYLGNFYVLDTADGISKYAGMSQSAKSQYFTGTTPDLSKAVDMAIDGSIWILGSDGNIVKYTKGKPDDFSLKSLDKTLHNPTRIITTVDMNNVYVLDNGNSRIVVFDKNGNYIAQYQSDIINTATAMDVSEKDKKVYVLSSGKVYEIDLK